MKLQNAMCAVLRIAFCILPCSRSISSFIYSFYGIVTVAVFDGTLSAPEESTLVT